MTTGTGFDFGNRLKQLRELRGMTQRQLADAAGMKPSQVCHYERNRQSPSIENLLRLSSALRFTPGSFLMRQKKEPCICATCGGVGVTWRAVEDGGRIARAALQAIEKETM